MKRVTIAELGRANGKKRDERGLRETEGRGFGRLDRDHLD